METVNRTTQEEADAEFRQLREGETEEQWNARMAKGPESTTEFVGEVPVVEEKVSREDQTPEDKMADYEKELSGNPETLAKYEENPTEFLEDDIAGLKEQPDTEENRQAIKNLEENLDILKNDNLSPKESDRSGSGYTVGGKVRMYPIDHEVYKIENSGLNTTTRANIDKDINNKDFSAFQSTMEDEIGRVDENGKVVSTPHSKEEIDRYDVDGYIDGAGEMRGGYGPKQGIKKLFPEMKDNEELMNSPQGEMLRMWNVNKGYNPKVLAALSQGLIDPKDRGAYHRGDKDINDIKGIDVGKIDPEELLYEMAEAYKNVYGFSEDSKSGKLPKNYNAYAERIVSLAKRHSLAVPIGLMEK